MTIRIIDIQYILSFFVGLIIYSRYLDEEIYKGLLFILIIYNIIDIILGTLFSHYYLVNYEYLIHHILAIVIFTYLIINYDSNIEIIKYLILAETTMLANSSAYFIRKHSDTIIKLFTYISVEWSIILVSIFDYIIKVYYNNINMIICIFLSMLINIFLKQVLFNSLYNIIINFENKVIINIITFMNKYHIGDSFFGIYFIIIRSYVLYNLYYLLIANNLHINLHIIYYIFIILHIYWFLCISLKFIRLFIKLII